MKQTKKLAVILALATLAAGVAGCGSDPAPGGTNQGSASGENTSQGNSSAEESSRAGEDASGVGEAFSFSYFAPIWDPYQEETSIYNAAQEMTNTTIEFEWVQQESFSDQLTAKIAGKDLPDVIRSSDNSIVADLARQGIIVPLTDYIDEQLPNFKRFITDADVPFVTEQSDGEIYGIGLVMDVKGAFSAMVRQDWLDNLGLPMPETWEDWVNTWTAFAQKDANGNGNPNDEIPLAVQYGTFKFLLNIFGIESNGQFSVVDGVYTYDPEHENYELFLDTMRDLYEKGILCKEFVTFDATAQNTAAANDTLGTTIINAELAKNYTVSLRESNEKALWSCIVPIKGPTGAQLMPARNKMTMDTYITAQAVADGKLEGILRYFNWIYSDEGILLTNFGLEGTHHELVDGSPVLLAPYNESFVNARTEGLVSSCMPFVFTEDVYMQILMGGKAYEEMDEPSQSFVDGMTINNDYYYTEPPVLKTEAYVNYSDLIEKQRALRDRYIMGQISKEEYNTQYQQLKDAGLSEVIEQGKEAYASLVQ